MCAEDFECYAQLTILKSFITNGNLRYIEPVY
jgi:hypothetical protein